jgi:hypothetical protein
LLDHDVLVTFYLMVKGAHPTADLVGNLHGVGPRRETPGYPNDLKPEPGNEFEGSPRRQAVVSFLKAVLAGGAVAVDDLELKAREAGLLGGRQHARNAKSFKWAKKTLCIRSIRNGFGHNGAWLWALPDPPRAGVAEPVENSQVNRPPAVTYEKQSEPVVTQPESPDRKGVPREWVYGIQSLYRHGPPPGVPGQLWQQFREDCERFLDEWAAKAAALGWTAEALFGCAPSQPLAHLQIAGLLWILRGRKLIKLYVDWAAIENLTDGSCEVFNRRSTFGRQVSLPWRLHDANLRSARKFAKNGTNPSGAVGRSNA